MLDLARELFDPLFNLMAAALTAFHDTLGTPWWLSIVLLTVVVRTLLFPLTFRQVRNMRKMQDLKPDMDAIRTKYKDDRQKQQQELMTLYGERKVNPMGGCLPVLFQFPVWIALYYTIRAFEHKRGFVTGGLFWFEDLTVYDPIYVLPVLYVATMMASQHLALRNTDPRPARIMRFMPVAFGVFLARFPAGLFVYWITTNVITFCQNYAVYKLLPHREPEGTSAGEPVAAGNATGHKEPLESVPRREGAGDRTNRTKRRKRKKSGKKR